MSNHHDTLDAFLVGAAMQASYNYSKLQRTERIRLLAQLKQTQLDPDLQRRVETLLQREIVVAERQARSEKFWETIGGFVLLAIGAVILFAILATCSSSSGTSASVQYRTASTTPEATATPGATPTPVQVRRAEPVEVRRATPVSLRQAEHELQKAWDALPASKQAALRTEEREWWRKKDKATGVAKLQMIEERTVYLLNQS
jgi:hypothetical protein